MKAQFVGCTLVVTPETDRERDELKYHGGSRGQQNQLWECWGWEEDEDSLSVQGLCPVGLQDWEILNYLRYLMELDERPFPAEETALHQRFKEDVETMDKIRQLLEVR